uniref:FecR protein domain-containing protein n=1 Tax=Schlesneria paludicola TaxID=360056 RepID=A0A7C2NZE6_9PLAN
MNDAKPLHSNAAFVRLWTSGSRRVYAYILTLVTNRSDAEDLLQGVSASPEMPGRARSVLRQGQEWKLLSGLAEFRFDRDARVTVEGPASFRIAGSQQIDLDRGTLVANVPPRPAGFTVHTPAATAIDLGTQFGVVLGSDGAPEFHVLQGQIRTLSPHLESEVLETNQASRYSLNGQVRQTIPAERDAFNGCLRLAAGIVDFQGKARFSARPIDALDGAGHARSDIIHVFLERQDCRLPRDLPVLSVDDGVPSPADEPTRTVLPAGTDVDVYFAHLQVDRSATLKCQMTLSRPVAGVVIEPDALDATDDLFALPDFPYLPPDRKISNRGAVYAPGSTSKTQDRLWVSADRRSITLQFEAQPNDVDQVRIVVPRPRVVRTGHA